MRFYNTEGAAYDTDDPSEIARLKVSRSHRLAPDAEPVQDPRFDPTQHGVSEVLNYLKDKTGPERDRVLAIERAGKARSTVLGDEVVADGAVPAQ